MSDYQYLGNNIISNNEELKTLNEWAIEYDVRIIDPDGFDRKDPYLLSKLISREEFEKGLPLCSIESKASKE